MSSMGPENMAALSTSGSPVSWPTIFSPQVFLNEQMGEGVEPQLEVQKMMLSGRAKG